MDSINVEKIQALRKYKEQQFVSNLLFYPLATLTFGVFCTSPFWFPSFYSSSKTLVYVSIPRIISLFLSAKSLFILGNLIVIFLLRESKVRLVDASYNNKSGDNVVKPILPKTRSKKVKIHKVRKEELKVQSSNPLCYSKNDRNPLKLTPPRAESEEVKMDAVFSQTSRVIPEVSLERVFVEPYSIGKVDEIRYVNEKVRRHRSSSEVEDQTREEAEEVTLWRVEESRETGEDQDQTKVENEARDNSKNRDKELVIPPSSTDELKRRADDFIAMVNMQIRIEAEDELLDAC